MDAAISIDSQKNAMPEKVRFCRCSKLVGMLMVLLFGLAVASPTSAQVKFEAYAGKPFGVAKVTVPITRNDDFVRQLEAMSIFEPNNRVLYPVFTEGKGRKFLSEIFRPGELPDVKSMEAFFLFKGDAPLTLKFYTSKTYVARLKPMERNPGAKRRLLEQWWGHYKTAAENRIGNGDYPPYVEAYLISMLCKRFGFEPPPIRDTKLLSSTDLSKTAELIAGSENLEIETIRTLFQQRGIQSDKLYQLPKYPRWPNNDDLQISDDIKIEPIARRVPRNCFYVRFGSWANLQWLKNLAEEHGGDLGRMINVRGFESTLGSRVESQLALEQNDIADLLGGNVVKDLAVIGRDFYFREGAALGVLIEQRNGLLGTPLSQVRRKFLEEWKDRGATMTQVEIAGRKVSFLSTPDNQLRSFYVVDDGFHLLSNSEVIVRQFLETAKTKTSIADSPRFQHARTNLPTSREDVVFAYFSPTFVQSVLAPAYQIENQRRVRAVSEILMLKIAKKLSVAEGNDADLSWSELIRLGYLPASFAQRADGSKPLIGQPSTDSLRGRVGSFIPIPDSLARSATEYEIEKYQKQLAAFQNAVKRTDPIVLGIRRFKVNDDNLERLVIDAQISPFNKSDYGWVFSILGEPMEDQVPAMPSDVISVRASLAGGFPLNRVSAHQSFLGIQDEVPAVARKVRKVGFFEVLDIAKSTPAYLGSWPKAGLIDLFPTFLRRDRDGDGYTKSLFGLHRLQEGNYSVVSFDKSRLVNIRPNLKTVRTVVPAQLQFEIGDITKSNIRTWVETINYQRALQTSQGNSKMIQALSHQLGLNDKEALRFAEDLFDAKFVCPLGGKYTVAQLGSGAEYVTSDAWPKMNETTIPEDYEAPLLTWFRGMRGAVLVSDSDLRAQLFLDLQRNPKEETKLPSFNLMDLGGTLFGGSKKDEKPKKE